MDKIVCPYCHHRIEVEFPSATSQRPLKSKCSVCHKPLALYAQETFAHQHTDRSIAAIYPSPATQQGLLLHLLPNNYSSGQTFSLPTGRAVMGRFNPDSKAAIQLSTADPDIGRNHLEFDVTGEKTRVRDLEHKGTTFINGVALKPNSWIYLSEGDVISVGNSIIIYGDTAHSDLELSDFDVD